MRTMLWPERAPGTAPDGITGSHASAHSGSARQRMAGRMTRKRNKDRWVNPVVLRPQIDNAPFMVVSVEFSFPSCTWERKFHAKLRFATLFFEAKVYVVRCTNRPEGRKAKTTQ